MPVFELIVKDVQTGETDFTGRYTADDTETAKLVFNDDAVYVAPHNKLLTRYDGVFRLNDYVSTTPLLSLSAAGLSDARAVGKITFGPAPSTLTQASGWIVINDVDLPAEGSLELYVEVDSIPTANFFIPAGTSTDTAAQIIAGAINDEPDFVGIYTATPVFNFVIIQAVTPGAAPNGNVIDVQLVKLVNPPDAFTWGGVTTDGGSEFTVTTGNYATATLFVTRQTLDPGSVAELDVVIGGVSQGIVTVLSTTTRAQVATLIANTINAFDDDFTAEAVGTSVVVTAKVVGIAFNGILIEIDTTIVTGSGDVEIGSRTTSGGTNSITIPAVAATGSLTVLTNGAYTSVDVSVSVGVTESVNITIDPTDTPTDITTAIRNGLIADGAFTAVWAVSGLGTQIIFTAVTAGVAGNNKTVTLNFKETTTGVSTALDTTIVNLFGGIDEGETIPEQIQLKVGNGTPITVAPIVGLESANSIATKALTALNTSIEFLNFTFTRTENIIVGVAILGGTNQNRAIGVLEDAGTTITTEGFSGGQNVFTQGALDPNTVYWYTARYVYRDGHKTKTAFPVVIKTGNANYEVKLNVDLASDVDGGYCDVEVFRKLGSNEFQRIDRFTPKVFEGNTAVYVDTGRPDIEPLDEQEYVWTTRHETHEMVQDRYVRANVVYSDKTLPELAETNTQDEVFEVTKVAGQTTIGNTLPFNTVFDVYVKGKYTDGSDSFFEKLTDFETDYDSEYLKVQQTKQLDGFKEFSFWAKYTTKPQEGIGFSTIDFANINLATTFSGKVDGSLEEIRPVQRPVNPRVFLGFNQITRTFDGGSSKYKYYVSKSDLYEFNRDETTAVNTTPNKYLSSADEPTTDGTALHPDFITISPFEDLGGIGALRYYRVFDADETTTSATYRLELTPALLKTINNSEIYLVVQAINVPTTNTEIDTNIIGSTCRVIGIEITKDPEADVTVSYDGGCVYLIIESGSVLDKIKGTEFSIPGIGKGTSHNLSAGALVKTYTASSESLSMQARIFFNLFGLNIEEDAPVAGEYTIHAVNSVTSPALYYLGRKDNEVDGAPVTLQTTGFDYEQESDGLLATIEYRLIEDYNIFSTLLTKDDLQELKEDFPYQIIWSEPFILGSSISGLRSFKFTNFLNLSNEYGAVVDVRYHNTKLFIFTERSLAVSNIGEVLTSTASGETFVDSSRFLSGAYFLLKNLPSIQPKSIVKYESMLFFSDGKDVWMITESPQNISNGAVELTDTGAVGVVDPVNKEYRISDNGQTWAYNWESQTWVGPYTYADTVGVTANQDMFSVNSNKIVRHNDTNAFDGANFDTVVESVADDLEESSIDKLFRKWYLDYEVEEATFVQTEGGDPVLDEDEQEVDMETSTNDFQYGKVYGEWLSPTSISEKNEVRGIGIKKEAQNAKRLYWKFLSNAADFVIRMVSFEWMPRNRR